jgi:hypothetical protein
MRTYWVSIGLLALVPSLTLAEDAEADLKDSIKLATDFTDVLKSVKDKASAEAAVPKLKALDERFAVLKKKEGDIQKLSAEERKKLQTKYGKAFVTAMKAIGPELKRIEKLPDVKALLKKKSVLVKKMYEDMEQSEKLKVNIAKTEIKTIDTVLQSYFLRFGEFPKNLKALAKGEKPFLDAESLTDPWKKPYQYDPAGPKNRGNKPDVWTLTPDKKVIGNWKEEKK